MEPINTSLCYRSSESITERLRTIDVDGPEGEKSLQALEEQYGILPRTRIHGSGRPDSGRHILFNHPGEDVRIPCHHSGKKLGSKLDIKGDGGYIVMPGSIHKSGSIYQVLDASELADAPDWLLPLVIGPGKPPAAPEGTSNGAKIPQGSQQDWLVKRAGTYRRHGDTEADIYEKLKIDYLGHCDKADLSRGDSKLAQIARSVCQYQPGNSDFAEWPDPEPLGEDLPIVPAFDLNFLPVSFRPLVADVAERMQVPLDFPAAAAIVALGGCVGRRARIRPKVEDSAWEIVPNLWGATIASPGFLKSPVMHAVTAPLEHIADVWRQEFAGQVADFENEKEKKELAHSAWRDQYKLSLKKNTPTPVEPDISLNHPLRRRLLVTDSTPEKLQEILSDNPAGIMVLRDELAGLIAEMDKEGREAQRAFFLQCWNGYGSFSVDRIGRGSIYIPHTCLSVFGNLQPGRLRSYLSDTLEGGFADDGLFQRHQILVWPDAPCDWKLVDRPPDNRALARVEKIFSILANLPTESVRLSFTHDAQQIFFDWWQRLEEKVRNPIGLHPALVAHLAKYRSLMPSLAGLFELADLVAGDQHLGEHHEISSDHAGQAVDLCAYLTAHAVRVYSCVATPEFHAARQLAGHVQRGSLAQAFTLRDIYRHRWSSLDSPERVTAAITLLEDANWVRRGEKNSAPTGGRPAQNWIVNPKALPSE